MANDVLDSDFEEGTGLVAAANYTNSQLQTGWGNLEIATSKYMDDEVQAYAAGLAEGYLTR